MTLATGFVVTDRAQRYIKQLVSHFGNKITTETTDTGGVLRFDVGSCDLVAAPDGIRLRASADSDEHLESVKNVVARHLERFGSADALRVDWQPGP